MRGDSFPRDIDVMTVVLHEFGHAFYLNHDCTFAAAVMCVQSNLAKQNLHEDDKRGETQLYGPWTSWEPTHVYSREDTWFTKQNVVGYFGDPNQRPELGHRVFEQGVPVRDGSQYELMAGYAQASNSLIYFKLFLAENDTGAAPNYVTIRAGMCLEWDQYNYQQKTMVIDFNMTDGTTLRDSELVDQYGYPLHPAARNQAVYPNNRWFRVSVNLSPLAGKQIKDWMIAYDNGNNGVTGPFRGYFDRLVLSCCGVGGFSRDYTTYLPLTIK